MNNSSFIDLTSLDNSLFGLPQLHDFLTNNGEAWVNRPGSPGAQEDLFHELVRDYDFKADNSPIFEDEDGKSSINSIFESIKPRQNSELATANPFGFEMMGSNTTLMGNFNFDQFLPQKSFFVDPNPSPLNVPLPANFVTSDGQITFPQSNAVIDVSYNGFNPQAQSAFQFAVNIWQSLLDSPVPISVEASFTGLGAGVLSSSRPTVMGRDFNGAPQAGTWYPIALANSIARTDFLPNNSDIQVSLNNSFNWYYGTDGNVPSGQFSFVTVALHELCTGLGFFGLMDNQSGNGSWGGGSGYPSIYDRFTENGSGQSLINDFPNPSTALGNQLTSNNIYFDGANANGANGGNRVKLYAPSTWQPGSSYVHLDEIFNNTPNALMTYSLGAGESIFDPGSITLGLLKDLGWKVNNLPPVPSLAINDVIITEGDSGITKATFRVTRTGNATNPITVNYATTNGTAIAGSDYLATSGTLTFAPNEMTKSITVSIIGDTVIEPDESFFVNLSNAVNAKITDSQGLGKISNDDILTYGYGDQLQTPLIRFQNTDRPGTYLFAGATEAISIRQNYPSFKEEGFAFQVAVSKTDPLMQTFYRFRNDDPGREGTYLFAAEQEAISIRQNYKNFVEEGVAFYSYSAGIGNGTTDYNRFQNSNVPGTYLFAGPGETQSIINNYPAFILEGSAFAAAN